MTVVLGPPFLRVAVDVADEGLATRLADFFRNAGARGRGGENDADVKLTVDVASRPTNGKEGFTFREGVYAGAHAFGSGRYDVARGTGEVAIIPSGISFLETFLRQVFLWEIYKRRALAFHSVAAALDGRAVVSCGASGSGKSTLAKMLRGTFAVYSDEMNCLAAGGEVWPLPFRGTGIAAVGDGGAPVAALAVHHPGPGPGAAFRADLLAAPAALRVLEANVVLPFAAPPEIKANVFTALSDAVNVFKVYDVTVPADGAAAAAGYQELLNSHQPDEVTR